MGCDILRKMLRVLLADGDAAFADALEAHLATHRDVRTSRARSPAEVKSLGGESDLIFLSTDLGDAMSLLEEVKRSRPETEVVMMATSSRMESAVRAMKLGASDYLVKPLRGDQVAMAIERAARVRRLADENRRLRGPDAARGPASGLVGTAAGIRRVREQIARVASLRTPVLFVGEPGTGKALAARETHREGGGRDSQYLAVRCVEGAHAGFEAEVDEALAKGAGGSIFVEEIALASAGVQSRLARSLTTGEVRLLASTSANLLEGTGRGTFRQDLLAALAPSSIALPHLRERLDDVPLLADALLKRRAAEGRRSPLSVSAEAMTTLLAYDWPGNVDELEQAIHRASELGEGDVLERRHLPPSVIQAAEARRKTSVSEVTTRSLREMESEVIEKLLAEHRGDTEIVSKLLKIDRSTLYRKIKRYQIPLDDMKE